MHMFDVLTVVPLALPLSLPSRRAVSYWDEVDGQRALRIKEAADGPVNIFYPDKNTMQEFKEMVMEEIAHILPPIN